jgi:UDP-GlcNAc:undecaprenyl-phosphate GlcNAc-1-phosphate transferase
MFSLPPYAQYLIAFATAVALALVFIPQIIRVSGKKMLFDVPDTERKFHANVVPHLGGIGIFFAYLIPASILIQQDNFSGWNKVIAALLMLFITGLIDDLRPLNATKKFLAQFLPAVITVILADIRLESLHGFLGIYELPYWFSAGFTIIGCIFISNAFNLLDGVDGLAASVGILCSIVCGILLARSSQAGSACLAFSLAGALCGFLRFNTAPAKIFMGDSGSLVIGFTIALLCVQLTQNSINNDSLPGSATLIIITGILSLMIFDTFRVFIARVRKGTSPFHGDRNHVHHWLLDSDFSQGKAVLVLVATNVFLITVSWMIKDRNINTAMIILAVLSLSLFAWLHYYRKAKKKREPN